MKFTKYDRIQLIFNILLIAATVLNILVITGTGPRLLCYVGFVLAIGGCVLTNVSTDSKDHTHRQTVSGSPFLAGLTYVTGIAWLLTFALIQFDVVLRNAPTE